MLQGTMKISERASKHLILLNVIANVLREPIRPERKPPVEARRIVQVSDVRRLFLTGSRLAQTFDHRESVVAEYVVAHRSHQHWRHSCT